MTDTPHIPGAEIADARLREIEAEFADHIQGLGEFPSRMSDGPGAVSALYTSLSLTEVLSLAREALAARIVPSDAEQRAAFVKFADAYWAERASSPSPNVPPQVNEAVTYRYRTKTTERPEWGEWCRADSDPHDWLWLDNWTDMQVEETLASPGTATAGASEQSSEGEVVAGLRDLKETLHRAWRGRKIDHLIDDAINILLASDQSRVERLKTALRPFANMLPDSQEPKDALQRKLQEWCQAARQALEALPMQPVEVTEEMIERVARALDPFAFEIDPPRKKDSSAKFSMRNSARDKAHIAINAILDAATRPSGDGIQAGRDEVIEECAKVIDAAEAKWFAQYQATMHPAKQGNILAKRNAALKLAAAIRALIVPQDGDHA